MLITLLECRSFACVLFYCVHIQIKASPLSPATAILCVSVHVCLCVLSCPSFEVYRPYRSLAENTGKAICDTIDTWHVSIDSTAVEMPPVGLPFLTFSVLAADTAPPPQHNGHFCLNFDCGKSFFPFRTHNVT